MDGDIGEPIEGQWEGDRFRLSHQAGAGWTLSLQLQLIAESLYWEIAPHAHCGQWKEVGLFELQTDALNAVCEFQDGLKVWQEPYLTNRGPVPAAIIWAHFAHAELACGEAPRGSPP